MFIIIHNKLINKCYFGTFGKHSVFGNGDVSNRKPNLRNWWASGMRISLGGGGATRVPCGLDGKISGIS